MELGNNRVWDYAADNYVHRLIQNKTDGKLVQLDEGGRVVSIRTFWIFSLTFSQYLIFIFNLKINQDEKMDSITLEVGLFVHILEM